MTRPDRILVTGFQKFHNFNENPSEKLLKILQKKTNERLTVSTALLPVTWQENVHFAKALREKCMFDAIVMTGLNSKVDSVQVEQRAINIQKSKFQDNSGICKSGEAIIEGAPPLLDTIIDTEKIAQIVTSEDCQVQSSLYPGTFVCNTLYYVMLHHLQTKKLPVLFIHVPLPSHSLKLERIAKTVKHIARETCLKRSNKIGSKRFDSTRVAENYLHSFINYERKNRVDYNERNYNLEGYKAYLQTQGDPHLRGKSIHVAGTKGKGCVCAIVASILSSHGLRTGLYTSPHLVNIRERIRLDGKAVSETDFSDLAYFQKQQSEKNTLKRSYRTTFELLTAMAFQYFRKQHTDWDVYETGMGGRLDCTNVIKPCVSAICRIGKDHIDSLGKTVLAIASEKAGIMKNGIPVVIGNQAPAVAQFLVKNAQKVGSPLSFAASAVPVKNLKTDPDGTSFSARISKKWFHKLRINLPGKFQIENCKLALAIIQNLHERGLIDLNESALRNGLQQCQWHGRFSVMAPENINPEKANGKIIIDGAHNPFAVRTLLNSTKLLFPNQPLKIIFGCAENKDADEMIRVISQYTDSIVLTSYNSPRSLPVTHLVKLAQKYCLNTQQYNAVKNAVNYVKTCIMQNELVVLTGSLYLAGECYEVLGMSEDCLNIF